MINSTFSPLPSLERKEGLKSLPYSYMDSYPCNQPLSWDSPGAPSHIITIQKRYHFIDSRELCARKTRYSFIFFSLGNGIQGLKYGRETLYHYAIPPAQYISYYILEYHTYLIYTLVIKMYCRLRVQHVWKAEKHLD